MIERVLVPGYNGGTIICPTGKASEIVAKAWISVRCDGGGTVQAWFQRSADSDGAAPGAGPAWEAAGGGPIGFRNAARPWTQVPDGTEYIQWAVNATGPGALLIEMQAK